MLNNEEKIKEFFSNEENVKKLTSNEEFMSKVSEGKATPETYIDEFRKFGMELNIDEAKVLQETVKKIMEKPLEKLDESELKEIAGGGTAGKVAAGIGLGVAGVALTSEVVGVGCLIASKVYRSKMEKAYENGDKSKIEKYGKKAINCVKVGAGFLTFGIEPALRHYEER